MGYIGFVQREKEKERDTDKNTPDPFAVMALGLQVVLIGIYMQWVRMEPADSADNSLAAYYAQLQDVGCAARAFPHPAASYPFPHPLDSIIIFVGFGFLMQFLATTAYTSVSCA